MNINYYIVGLRRVLPEKALIILSKGTGVPIWDLRKRDLHGIFRKIELDLEKMINLDIS